MIEIITASPLYSFLTVISFFFLVWFVKTFLPNAIRANSLENWIYREAKRKPMAVKIVDFDKHEHLIDRS